MLFYTHIRACLNKPYRQRKKRHDFNENTNHDTLLHYCALWGGSSASIERILRGGHFLVEDEKLFSPQSPHTVGVER